MEHLLPSLETEVVFELKSKARAAVVEEASRAMERRLRVGPYEREDLNVLQKIIKADSRLKHDQVRRGVGQWKRPQRQKADTLLYIYT